MSTQDDEDLQGRVGPFVTYVERVRPDGVIARWDSRRHRKHQGALTAGSTWWAPRARGWWIGVLFAVGRDDATGMESVYHVADYLPFARGAKALDGKDRKRN